ncbi:MAG: methyltransferase family protein [Humibacillus sp.]|nr:methyltransferase family protein [Humibacillus sp.]
MWRPCLCPDAGLHDGCMDTTPDSPAPDTAPAHEPTDWEELYAAAPVWSSEPNGALVAEVADLAPGRALDVGCG